MWFALIVSEWELLSQGCQEAKLRDDNGSLAFKQSCGPRLRENSELDSDIKCSSNNAEDMFCFGRLTTSGENLRGEMVYPEKYMFL